MVSSTPSDNPTPLHRHTHDVVSKPHEASARDDSDILATRRSASIALRKMSAED